jgi:hypothetical protein
MADTKALLIEDNVISLRTAMVLDHGELISFRLLPREWDDPNDSSFVTKDQVWLYRHDRTDSEIDSSRDELFFIRKYVRNIAFPETPKFTLVWTDSGNGVAVLVDGQPWALIDESTRQGYSKGILEPSYVGNPWNQELFEQTFPKRIL